MNKLAEIENEINLELIRLKFMKNLLEYSKYNKNKKLKS